MTRHSKNNTSRSIFTFAERSMLKQYYGTQSQRVGLDSKKPFWACSLCLALARDPVVNQKDGSLFCRECILSHILSEREKYKARKKEIEQLLKMEELERQQEIEQLRQKALDSFEKSQQLGNSTKRKFDEIADSKESSEVKRSNTTGAKSEQEKKEKVASSFWLAELMPNSSTTPSAEDLKSALKNAQANTVSMKDILSVKFTPANTGKIEGDAPEFICPLSTKVLTNKINIIVNKIDGQVLSTQAWDSLLSSGEVKDKDGLPLKMDATGYASAGNSVVKSARVNFQG